MFQRALYCIFLKARLDFTSRMITLIKMLKKRK